MKKYCDICGKASGIYPLCREHLEMKQKGQVFKNEDGKWNLTDIKLQFNKKEKGTCVLCGNETANAEHLFCQNCYYKKVKDIRKLFDHNRDLTKIREHYFKLKDIDSIKNKNNLDENICLMYALAEEAESIYDYEYLISRVTRDINELVHEFEQKKEEAVETNIINDKDVRKKWPAEHRCEDGHYVRSRAEAIIDDYLYHNKYLHAYEKMVYMPSDENAVVISDFYIPEGEVYIEYWGLEDDAKYNERKETKKKLYQENNLNLIEITDNQLNILSDYLPRELGKYIKRKK